MEDTQNFDSIFTNPVGQDIWEPADDQFPGACNTPGATHAGVSRERFSTGTNMANKFRCCFWAVFGNVCSFMVEVFQGLAKPSNLHISSRRHPLPHRMQNHLHPPPRLPAEFPRLAMLQDQDTVEWLLRPSTTCCGESLLPAYPTDLSPALERARLSSPYP